MIRNLGTIVCLLAILAGAAALTFVSPMPLTRPTVAAPPHESKLVCANMPAPGVLFVDGAETIAPLGGDGTAAAGPTVALAFEESVVIQGGMELAGGAVVSSADARAYVPCAPPLSRGTIVVPGTAGTDLLVVNPDASEAVVDLTLYGADGEIVALGARGIAVGPEASRTIALSVLADVEGPVGVAYRASRGRAAVVARTDAPGALEAVTASTVDTQHLLAGVPAGATSVSVLATNPGNERATLEVTALGESLEYTPEGGDEVIVEPYSTVSLDLAPALAGEATGLHVVSDVEVGVGLATGTGTDPAVASPVTAAVELGAFAPAGGTLQLSNPGGEEATAEVTTTVIDADPITSTMTVPAGVTVTVPMAAEAQRGQTVTVVSDKAGLFGAIVDITDGATIIPLVSHEAPEVSPVDVENVPTLR